MRTAEELRRSRGAEGITLDDVSQRSGIDSGRLCRIEHGRLDPKPGELDRIGKAIDDIVTTRERVKQMAASAGLSLVGVL
jgi:predicted transcriptional regulator